MTKPLYIAKLEVHDFRGIKAWNCNAKGHHIIIEGPNGSGKTSRVDSIYWTLTGKSEGAVVNGDGPAKVKMTLSDGGEESLVVTRIETLDGRKTLKVSREDGKPMGSAQSFLNDLISNFALDPTRFMDMRPQDQADVLLSLSSRPPPVATVMEITGIDYPARDGESGFQYLMRLSKDGDGEFYTERKEAGLAVEITGKALAKLKEELQATPEAREVPSEEHYDAEISTLTQRINERRTLELGAQHAKNEAIAAQRELFSLNRYLDDRHSDLRQAEEALSRCKTALQNARDMATAQTDKLHAALVQQKAAEALVSEKVDYDSQFAVVRTEAAAARAERRKAESRQDLLGRVNRLRAQLVDEDAALEAACNALERLRELRKKQIVGDDFGVTGLDVHDKLGPTINGVPLKSCAMSEQLNVALAVGKKQNKRLRFLRIDDGERFDMRTRYDLLNRADQDGYQVIITAVSNADNLEVTISDA